MRSTNFFTILVIILLALLVVSIAINIYLFNFGKQNYLQLNITRLDPLGLELFSSTTESQDIDSLSVIFFGDSRAAQWPTPAVDGFEFLNRGIEAQTSAQTLLRYDSHIKNLNSDILVIQVCINDLKTIPLFPEQKQSIIANCEGNISQIVQKARDQGLKVVLSTIFPVGEVPINRKLFWSEEVAEAVNEVNLFLHSLAEEQVLIFDAYSILADEDGKMRQSYSHDELHLKPAGYEALNSELVLLFQSLNE